MKKYYFNDGKAQYGPFTLEELKPQINRETAIWYEGMSDWLSAKDVPEVAMVLPPPIVNTATPPPIKPTAPPVQETKATVDYDKAPIILRSITHQEKKSSKAGWWILGGSVACIFLFLWVTGFFYSRPHYDPPPTDPVVVNTNFIESTRLGVDFRPVPLGGVRDVVVTLRNDWYYPIDEATVIISYIKENGKSAASEIVTFYNVSIGETKTVSANGSSRGVEAVVYFGSAKSIEGNLDYMQPDS